MVTSARLVSAFLATMGFVLLAGDSAAQSPFVKVGPDKKFQAPPLKDVRVVDPLPDHVDWKLDVTPYTAPKVISAKPIPLAIPAGDGVRGLALNRTGDRALIGYAAKGSGSSQLMS